jgi:predicted DNA-binding protein
MISRQRKYQLKHRAKGLCTICTTPAVTADYCRLHADKHDERKKSKSIIVHSLSVKSKSRLVALSAERKMTLSDLLRHIIESYLWEMDLNSIPEGSVQ